MITDAGFWHRLHDALHHPDPAEAQVVIDEYMGHAEPEPEPEPEPEQPAPKSSPKK